jgi:hypothetical protein
MADVEIIFTPWPYDAVARGVALLDKRIPEWRIAASEMNLVELWQLAGSPDDYFLLGFSTRWGDSYVALERAWREAIAGDEA